MNDQNETTAAGTVDRGETIERGEFITWRKRLGLTRQGMADYMGVSIYCIRKYENGQRGIYGAAAKLVRVLQQLEAIAPDIARRWRENGG